MMPYGQLVSALRDQQVYEVELDAEKYQVEIEILEDTEQYVHVMVAVDDGSLPVSALPVTHGSIRNKPPSSF
jgi:predicted metal-dependent hydrolase